VHRNQFKQERTEGTEGNPAVFLKLADKRKVWEDMLQVLEKLQRPISEKQRAYFLKA
jgi:hypothetical protein